MMLHVRLDDELGQKLKQLAEMTDRTQSFYARKAIEEFVEDQLDYMQAVDAKKRMHKTGEKPVPYEKLVAELNLDQDDADA